MLYKLLNKTWLQSLMVILGCILLNVNTFRHEYALDDEMVLNKNILVHKGIYGIPEILSQDAYKSYFSYMGVNQLNLTGGRYRPLSIVSFAIEQQLFGKTIGQDFEDSKLRLQRKEAGGINTAEIQEEAERLKLLNEQLEQNALELASIRHIIQIVFYCICCLCMLWFLRLTFGHIPHLPLFATLLFVFHPVHTEVVANVKSRDEIFSLMFILLTCSFFIRHFKDPKPWRNLLLGLACYVLAFLSKEYAFALVLIMPVIYYLQSKEGLFAFLQKGWFWALIAASALFFIIRYAITKGEVQPTTEVLNDPYLYASSVEKAASVIAVWLEYLRVLFYPAKLSADYSFKTFPYLDFSAAKVWISFLFWLGVVVLSIVLFLRRNLLALPLIWFLAYFVMINNLFFGIGATMGERLIFHSSLGFCILLAFAFVRIIQLVPASGKMILFPYLLLLPVLFAFGKRTVDRNKDWKNDYSLFTTDVNTMPNSVMLNNNAGTQVFNRGHKLIGNKSTLTDSDKKIFYPYVLKSLDYFNKAVELHPNFINARINRGLCFLFLGKMDSAMVDWMAVKLLYSGRNPHLVKHAATLLNKGLEYGAKKDFKNAVKMIESASVLDPENAVIWNNLGGAYYMSGDMGQAKRAFEKALQINPSLEDARNGYNAADYNLKMQSPKQ